MVVFSAFFAEDAHSLDVTFLKTLEREKSVKVGKKDLVCPPMHFMMRQHT